MTPPDTMLDSASATLDDTRSQIASLRRQIETLMSDRVNPALSQAAGRAQETATKTAAYTKDQAEALSGQVRSQPLTSVIIAAGVGFLLGRLFRL